MDTAAVIDVDAKSALYQFAVRLKSSSYWIDQAAQRDAKALEILSAPALPEVLRGMETRSLAKESKIHARSLKRKWTRRDEKRLNWMMGWVGGKYPACRVSRLVTRFGLKHKKIFQVALDEARQDGIGSDVGWLVLKAKDAYETLLGEASELSQWKDSPLPSQIVDSYRDVCVATNSLIECAPSPKPPDPTPDGPCGIYQWRFNGIVTTGKMQQKTWKLAGYLYERVGRKVAIADLIGKGRVFDDSQTDDQNVTKQGRRATKWFRENEIPLVVSSSTKRGDQTIWMELDTSE